MPRKKIQNTPESRRVFWSRVKKGGRDECWLWTGTKQRMSEDYVRGIFSYKGGNRKAHLFAAEMCYGPRPEGKETLHACDNPLCVNPRHLSFGTASQNAKDCVERNRNKLIEAARRKSECIRGHPLYGENLYEGKDGRRHCRACAKMRFRLFEKGITKKRSREKWPDGNWNINEWR